MKKGSTYESMHWSPMQLCFNLYYFLSRFYVQFPLEIAHEYHHDDEEMIPHQALSLLPTQVNLGLSRLDPRVVDKINELVARGVTDIYQVKHGVINFVEKDLFLGGDEPIPARHNKCFFPTVTDLQNHIHQAMLALESGALESLPPVSLEIFLINYRQP